MTEVILKGFSNGRMDGALLKQHEKKPNPRATANPLSALTFSWILPLFWIGYKRELELTDIYQPLKEHSATYLGDKFERIWNAELKKCKRRDYEEKADAEKKTENIKKRHPSLLWVVTKALGGEILVYGLVLAVVEVLIRSLQPLFLGRLIRYFTQQNQLVNNATHLLENPDVIVTKRDAYFCALGVIVCSASEIIIEHPFIMAVLHVGMKLNVGCVSLIYRKALRLSKTALGETTVGEIVNLLSNDVQRFDYSVLFVHYLWVGPLQTIVVTFFLWREIGVASIIGVVTLLAAIPMQVWLGKRSSILRLKTAMKTDKRLRLMNEIITGIQVIKMYTWERPFAKLASLARRKEVDVLRKMNYIRSVLLSFFIFHTRVAIFLSILHYVIDGNYIDAEKIFVVTGFYNILRVTMSLFFPQGIAMLAEAMVSVKRLENFMLYEETLNLPPRQERVDDCYNDKQKDELTNRLLTNDDFITNEKNLRMETVCKEVDGGPAIHAVKLANVDAKWMADANENTLSSINLDVEVGSLTAVVGLVGSGKSSLLHVLLRELPIKNGKMTINGTLSYASQEPWLFAGSVRQNILFGEPFDRQRYKEVTRVCSLEADFLQLPFRDNTIVSDRGVSLSGGQRARINLARAVYKKADIYLLDDPLSAVDTHVGKHLFEDCISGYLQKKTCILITHQLQYLNNIEHIVMLEHGQIISDGSYEKLLTTGKYFSDLLMATKHETEDSDGDNNGGKLDQPSKHSSLQSMTSSVDDRVQGEPPEMEEMRASGNVGYKVYKAYFKSTGGCCFLIGIVALCVLTQLLASSSDFWITYWVKLEEKDFSVNALKHSVSATETGNTTAQPLVSLLSTTPAAVNRTFLTSDETNDTSQQSTFHLNRITCIYIFTFLTIATVVSTLVRTFLMFDMCINASINLHNNMFNAIARTTMRFFNTNTSGRILNRFSKDIGSIDEQLPIAVIDCISIALTLIAIITIVSFVNNWLIIPTFIIAMLFYYMREFYLNTSRSIKRLEGVTRSPIFSHLSASLQGLSTIRAFRSQQILEKEFDNHVDLHTSAWFMFMGSNHSFGFWLDFFCVVYITLVTLSFLVMDSATFGGNVGLAITQSLALTGMFQWFMRQTAELENFMTSVERVLEYTNLPQESPMVSLPGKVPEKSWPSEGKIVFDDVSLFYDRNDPPVLKNLSFTVEAGEKVGIVGRTGAGKSSLISALYRLTEVTGEIFIDDVATSPIGLHELRSKISIIPQEPFLFSGSMRHNLDPFDEFPDNVLWSALDEVNLKDAVNELPGGLNAKMSEGGSNFSAGQRQLVCLARAIIRNNKILILDEATANVDPQTDNLIQSTIRNKFANCTMLTIAHRLHTIMDSDKVLVMDAGVSVEYDQPHILLKNEKGYFYKMVEQTGRSTADVLHKIASNCYKKYIDED